MNKFGRMSAAEYQEYMRTGKLPGDNAAPVKKPSKMHNVRTELDGKMYASKKEANRAAELKLLLAGKEVVEFFEQVPFLLPGGIKYKADFVVLWADGHWTVEDTKGFLTTEYKLKKKLMRETRGIEIMEL